MTRLTRHTFLALAAVLALGAAPVSAGPTLIIEFTGLDLLYAGGLLCDATTCAGNFGVRAEADPLTTMAFGYDYDNNGSAEVPIGVLTTNIWADVRLPMAAFPNVAGTYAGGPGVGIFDILTKNSDPAFGLALNTASWTFSYSPLAGSLSFFFGGGDTLSIYDQSLPFSLYAHTPVTFTFTTPITNNTRTFDLAGNVTGFQASGSGTISAPVPEPGTLLLLGSGISALALRRRRHAKA